MVNRNLVKNVYTKEFVDVTLACGDEQIKAHKVSISARVKELWMFFNSSIFPFLTDH